MQAVLRKSFGPQAKCLRRVLRRPLSTLSPLFTELMDAYEPRHIGPQEHDKQEMLRVCGVNTMQELIDETIPQHLRRDRELRLPAALGEQDALETFREIMNNNKVFRSHIGQGYYPNFTPSIILRCLLENPSWYTPYTPYQAEIAQGRLEMLLNFQTMICELTGMEISNASLLDEGLAAAEALVLAHNTTRKRDTVLLSSDCFRQTLAVCDTRLSALGLTVKIVDDIESSLDDSVCGVLTQYPCTNGKVKDFTALNEKIHAAGAKSVMAADLLACTVLKPPGEMGADAVVGTNQRFGVPMGFGGPHAGFLATKEEHKRKVPGRLIGVSLDSRGKKAYRLSLQTREQHIRRDKATSNICTAQALLANISAAYAIYHGPEGLKAIGNRVYNHAVTLAENLNALDGVNIVNNEFFDTLCVEVADSDAIVAKAHSMEINVRKIDSTKVCISLDETTKTKHLVDLITIFGGDGVTSTSSPSPVAHLQRVSPFLTHPIFNSHHSETAMMRYLYNLEKRDLGLNTAAMPLGSCTMKLNAASCMLPVTWPTVNNIHPFVPADQRQGYAQLISEMEEYLGEITGFDGISLQPNSGSQGEYAGLMAIAAYHRSQGNDHRVTCLIPTSAHGTNPASAAFAGMKIVVIKCDIEGNIDLKDLEQKAEKHKDTLSALMVTYPSTHGVFEEKIKEACEIIHNRGGQVYIDGANLQARVGYMTPANFGADVCHLNLHKTFCIPHGGGGPGLGPIGVKSHLCPFLPSHPEIDMGGAQSFGTVSAAPWSSTSILSISYMYIRMMGPDGLKRATETAILSANYMLTRLKEHYKVLYTGTHGRCAHEFIIDLRPYKKHDITEEDIAKRLMDFNLHAPTMSWPVSGTLMWEPTESEPKWELDRMCESMIQIKRECDEILSNNINPKDGILRNAPHTADMIASAEWDRPYTRMQAAYPIPSLKDNKYWPYVGRIDNAYGDKNVYCTCPPLESYES